MTFSFTQKGDWETTTRYLNRMKALNLAAVLNKYGAQGVAALSGATPVRSGQTAGSWSYDIVQHTGYCSIRWHNSNIVGGKPLAILLQYGHGTGTGGYVQGRDYINPAIRPIFDRMADEAWREVTK
jgi:hypothetical protein